MKLKLQFSSYAGSHYISEGSGFFPRLFGAYHISNTVNTYIMCVFFCAFGGKKQNRQNRRLRNTVSNSVSKSSIWM